MSLAPIIVFAYKRPALLKKALEALSANPEASGSALTVFCDGPKTDATESERKAIEQTRDAARSAQGFSEVIVVAAERNKGLAASVIDGVTATVSRHGRVIVVEEDVTVALCFLRYMNDALERFAKDDRVLSIGSWNYFAPGTTDAPAFFLRYPDSIAWATWKRAWDLFEPDGNALQEALARTGRKSALEADGAVRYFGPMMQAQLEGRVDSWAIRWTATSVLHGKLNLYPRESMARHEGFGSDATHERGGDDYNAGLRLAATAPELSGLRSAESEPALVAWAAFVNRNFTRRRGLRERLYQLAPPFIRAKWRRMRTPGEAHASRLAFEPVSRVFGLDRGTAIDRHYIERFLSANRDRIHGHAMEIGEARYLKAFGANLSRAEVLIFGSDPGAGERAGDLTRPESLPKAELEAFICTQTLNFIYDVKSAVAGLHAALKPGGTALVTVAALAPISRHDAERWGDFWRFTPQGVQRMFEDAFGAGNVEVTVFGNSYAATCFIMGFAKDECEEHRLDHADPDYPVVIGIKAIKA
ncbi:MAG: hypothetical protein IPM12_12540 [Flavobacteriales bacterium]|nr:hypothetical protein [Flavobacteriales bacterium]